MPNQHERPLPCKRGPGFAVVMSLVTFGFYTYYWLFRTFREVQCYRAEGDVDSVVAARQRDGASPST